MSAAADVGTVVEAFLGPDPPLVITCWDGSTWGDPEASVNLTLATPRAVRRLVWNPTELGLARAFVTGELRLEGPIFDLFELRDRLGGRDEDVSLRLHPAEWARVANAARRIGAIGLRPAAPAEEARLTGPKHSRRRDAAAISHHYDVGNDFYRVVLGPSLTYSCAYFPTPETTLEEAQHLKYELVCRKLGLRRGMRLLDVGCGWGGMVLHAAKHHGVEAVGVTISAEQASLARERVSAAGLEDRVEIRLRDYRDIDDGPYDAISSIGMFEHVGIEQLGAYLETLRAALRVGGRLLNHAISRSGGDGGFDADSFAGRYVFPDGQLHEVGRVISALDDMGFECRDVESLREHYALTLRRWIANLEDRWEDAVALVGAPRARIWQLYMAGSAVGFEANRLNVHQVLVTRPTVEGDSGMPRTRTGFLAHDTIDLTERVATSRM